MPQESLRRGDADRGGVAQWERLLRLALLCSPFCDRVSLDGEADRLRQI